MGLYRLPTDISSEIYYNGKNKTTYPGTDTQKDRVVFRFSVSILTISLKFIKLPYVYTFNNSPYIICKNKAE